MDLVRAAPAADRAAWPPADWHLAGPWLVGSIATAAVVWAAVFRPEPGFWTRLAGATFVLGAAGVALGPGLGRGRWRSEATWGAATAALLYGVFAAGKLGLGWLGAGAGIAAVYDLKLGLSEGWIALALVFPIGPGEELFWRGLVLPGFSVRWGKAAGLLAMAVVYGLVHAVTGNPVLILAAFAGGLAWGLLALWRGGLRAAIVAHILWDLAVFVLAPLA